MFTIVKQPDLKKTEHSKNDIFPFPNETWSGLERLPRDKHSGVLRKSVNYGRKKLNKISPWKKVTCTGREKNV
jgi:hypothetical protein